MLTLSLILSLCLNVAVAKGGNHVPQFADYIVPTTPELVPHSRFKVRINAPYQGDTTQLISYTFPLELTGEPGLTVNLKKVAGTDNNWESPEMKAYCTTLEDTFSCNLHFVKTQTAKPAFFKSAALGSFTTQAACANSSVALIDMMNVKAFLEKSGSTGVQLEQKLAVVQSFKCSEPAGILSYEFD